MNRGLEPHQRAKADTDNWAARIRASWQASIAAIIQTGQLLIEAKEAIEHGKFEEMVESNLPFGPRTAQMFVAIASDERLTNAKHVSLLPPSWGALYVISRMDDAMFEAAIEDGTINPEARREDLKRCIRISISDSNPREDNVVETIKLTRQESLVSHRPEPISFVARPHGNSHHENAVVQISSEDIERTRASSVRFYADRVERGEAKEGPRGYKQIVADELARRKILRVGQGRIPPAAGGLDCQEQLLACLREERDVIDNIIYTHKKRDWGVTGMNKIISALEVVVAEIDSMIASIENVRAIKR